MKRASVTVQTPEQVTCTTAAVEARAGTDPLELECHVLPLLDAIVWMGLASNKLSSIDGLKDHLPRMRWMDDISGPECADAYELMSSVAWAAADLLRRSRQERGSA